MKKVLLVYPGYIVREQPLNILYVASAVHAAGHGRPFSTSRRSARGRFAATPSDR
jgi:hypothetical protein